MIGRFIIECDTEHFDMAREAITFLMENPEHPETLYSQTDGEGTFQVKMHAKRLKKSIRVRQVLP